MNQEQRYLDAVLRLKQCAYDVFLDEPRYRVQHVTDSADISYMNNLNELVELVELFEWREQEQRHLRFVTT